MESVTEPASCGFRSAGHSTAKVLLTNAGSFTDLNCGPLGSGCGLLWTWEARNFLPPRSEEPIREAFILVFSWITVLVSTYHVTWPRLRAPF